MAKLKRHNIKGFINAIKQEASKQSIMIPDGVYLMLQTHVTDFWNACDIITEQGLTYVNSRGDVAQNPAFKVKKDAYDRILATLKAYVLTKKVGDNDYENSPLATFIRNSD